MLFWFGDFVAPVFAGTAPQTVQSLSSSPLMQKAVAAMQRGDSRRSAALFREAAVQGNPLAQVTLGEIYFEGRGAPQNTVEALTWLKKVIQRNQEPTRSMAEELLRHISTVLKNSPNHDEKGLGLLAALLPLIANPYAQKFGENYHPRSESFGHMMMDLHLRSEEDDQSERDRVNPFPKYDDPN